MYKMYFDHMYPHSSPNPSQPPHLSSQLQALFLICEAYILVGFEPPTGALLTYQGLHLWRKLTFSHPQQQLPGVG